MLQGRRAAYGERVLEELSDKLTSEFGRGFTKPALVRMAQFATKFAKQEIVATLSQQLGWSHFVELIPLDDRLRLDFYAEMCRLERWSVRTLRMKIGSMLYERTALSKKPEKLAELELKGLREADKLTPDMVFRDPYLLDFLDLHGNYQETDLEAAILREMEAFILELGVGFSFVARQKRMQIGDRDHYLDLLFYHRKLKRLVAIELKLERFKAEFKGQMELYLRWLEAHERQPGEAAPIGLILCAGKNQEEVSLLRLDRCGIRVAEYMTELPRLDLLKARLHRAIMSTRARLDDLPRTSRLSGPKHFQAP